MEASLVHRNVLIKYTATNPNISDTTNISGNLFLTDVIQALQSGFISEKHIGNYFRKAISTIISEKQKASCCCCCCCLHINRSGLNHTQLGGLIAKKAYRIFKKNVSRIFQMKNRLSQ